jgi:hypothetical protein
MALIIAVLVVAAIYVPRYRLRTALRQMISRFRSEGATSAARGTTLEKLGLVPRNPLEGMFRGRDFRPQALQLLREANIIRATEEGTLYLSEEELDRSPLKTIARLK